MITQNQFVFVSPMRNASSTLARMLHSVVGQSYPHWRIVLIDDASDEAHVDKCDDIITAFKKLIGDDSYADGSRVVHTERITTVWNSERKWEVANVLKGISMCHPLEIVCRLDADDCLVDLDALLIMNSAYVQTGCDVAWSMHRWGFSDRNISGPLMKDVSVYAQPWVTSHLKTFRKGLIDGINDENFRGADGEYIKRCGDQAIYLPVLHVAKDPLFVPRVLYGYTIDEQGGAVYNTQDARFQKSEADFIRNRGFVV